MHTIIPHYAKNAVCARGQYSIQKLLGHAWLTTTQTYVAANDRQVQADYDAASRELEGWR